MPLLETSLSQEQKAAKESESSAEKEKLVNSVKEIIKTEGLK